MEKPALDDVLGEDKDAWHETSADAHALTNVSRIH
jgi:hypothetical protein